MVLLYGSEQCQNGEMCLLVGCLNVCICMYSHVLKVFAGFCLWLARSDFRRTGNFSLEWSRSFCVIYTFLETLPNLGSSYGHLWPFILSAAILRPPVHHWQAEEDPAFTEAGTLAEAEYTCNNIYTHNLHWWDSKDAPVCELVNISDCLLKLWVREPNSSCLMQLRMQFWMHAMKGHRPRELLALLDPAERLKRAF